MEIWFSNQKLQIPDSLPLQSGNLQLLYVLKK